MDNLTHALAGMAVAEAAVQWRSASGVPVAKSWRRVLYVVSVLANNLPDVDLLLTGMTGGKLGYLLHHRGYTHTLLVAPFLGLLPLVAVVWLCRQRAWLWHKADWIWLTAVAMFGGLLHLGMDGWGSYGVHPFWPWNDRWYYGDTVFVVEPWLWLTLIPALAPSLGRFWRGAVQLIGIAAFAALLWLRLAPLLITCVIAVWYIGLSFGLRRVSRGWRIAAGIAAAFGVVSAFSMMGVAARERAEEALRTAFPGWQTRDLGVMPLPADPLCWRLTAVQQDAAGGRLALRDGTVAALPSLLAASDCPKALREPSSVLRRIVEADTPAVAWSGEFNGELAELRGLWRENCEAAAFLRFARSPYWFKTGSELRLGDLRFDGSRSGGFADLRLATEPGACPQHVPPWEPPLGALLTP